MPTPNNITLIEKLPESKINEDELYRQIYVYRVNDKVAYMMAVIEGDGLPLIYNMDEDYYYDTDEKDDQIYTTKIPEEILKELEIKAMTQIESDYKERLEFTQNKGLSV